jgi:pimeloyl-ACP methyl ester carboxylesterase
MVNSGYAPADGTGLYYEVAGNGSPVVLLHPGQGGSILWDRQFLSFAREHQVIRYDARGFGRSERPDAPFSPYEDLRAVLDALGVGRAALVGLSYGGLTAIDFAIAYPERVSALVLVNSGLSGYQYMHLGDVFSRLRAASEREDLDAWIEVQLETWFDGPERTPQQVDRATRDEVRRILSEQVTRNRARGHSPQQRDLGAVARLSEIRSPTLVVESALDVPDIRAIASLLEDKISNATRVVIDNAAHLVNVERPDEFAAAVLPFLRERMRT